MEALAPGRLPSAPSSSIPADGRVRALMWSSFISATALGILALAVGLWTPGNPLYLGRLAGLWVLFPVYPSATILSIAALVLIANDLARRRPVVKLMRIMEVVLAAFSVAAVLPVVLAGAAGELSSVQWYLTYGMFLPGSFLAAVHALFVLAANEGTPGARQTSASVVLGFVGSMGAPLLAFALFSYRLPGIGLVALGLAGLAIAADALIFERALRARGAKG